MFLSLFSRRGPCLLGRRGIFILFFIFIIFGLKSSIPSDDAFFNWNWVGPCGVRWAGPGLLAGWAVGCWIVCAEVGPQQW